MKKKKISLVFTSFANNFARQVLQLPQSRSSSGSFVLAVKLSHQDNVWNIFALQFVEIVVVDVAIAQIVSEKSKVSFQLSAQANNIKLQKK